MLGQTPLSSERGALLGEGRTPPKALHKDDTKWLLYLTVFVGVLFVTLAAARTSNELGASQQESFKAASENLTSNSSDIGLSSLDVHPSDLNASELTKLLFYGLHTIADQNAILFGHQYSNVFGQHFNRALEWSDKEALPGVYSKSDVANATGGDYPVVFGYNLQDIIDGKNITDYVRWAVEQGAMITYYWQAHNPINDGESHDCSTNGSSGNVVETILEKGEAYETFIGWLDQIADFFLKFSIDGKTIPIIFRPYHECTADWYWWGTSCIEDHDYIDLWLLTQDYIVNTRGVHSVLWEYAPSKPADDYALAFEDRYPGDDRVDIVGFDRYSAPNNYADDLKRDCKVVTAFASERGKIAALSETGITTGINKITEEFSDHYNFFTDDLLFPIMEACPTLTYVLTFSNFNSGKYWVPLPGQPTYPGFYSFYESSQTFFLGDTRWRKLEYVTQATERMNEKNMSNSSMKDLPIAQKKPKGVTEKA